MVGAACGEREGLGKDGAVAWRKHGPRTCWPHEVRGERASARSSDMVHLLSASTKILGGAVSHVLKLLEEVMAYQAM